MYIYSSNILNVPYFNDACKHFGSSGCLYDGRYLFILIILMSRIL